MSPVSIDSSRTTEAQAAVNRVLLESGDPLIDGRAFRRCLSQFATGVTVVTARHGHRLAGIAVNSFAAVSLSPPLVLWSIRRESTNLHTFLQAGHYAVSVLAEDQADVSQLFGSGHPERFQQTRWHPGLYGSPLIENAIAHFECRLLQAHEGGDHLILIGQVERYARYDGAPLLFSQGHYGITHEHPALTDSKSQPSQAHALRQDTMIDSELLRQMVYASQRLSAGFESRRQALGVTMPMSRLLNRMMKSPGTIAELSKSTFLEREEITDAIASLMLLGWVDRKDSGAFDLTQTGRERQAMIATQSANYMQQKLASLPDSDVAAFKRVLAALNQN